MKTIKSYSCLISGNKSKIEFLEDLLKQIEDLSSFVFNQGKSSWTFYNFKTLYHLCRKNFPSINSKILQNFIKLYQLKPGKKSPKSPINPLIYIDQNFNIKFDSSKKFSNYWLRFSRRNFPLLGKNNLKKISDFSKVKAIQIYKRNEKLYCKLTYVEEIPDITIQNPSNIIGCDVNYKRMVLSDNSFKMIKQLAHRKIEHKKNNQKKRNLTNYSKDYLHKLTTQISKDLSTQGVEVLVLENLRNLRKSSSRKNGTSKGKMINYIINSFPYSMFQIFLKYKCLNLGIKVEFINPAYTSKTCSRCGSLNTSRPKQEIFICNDCNFQLNADLNGSRNIEKFYRNLNGLPVNLAQIRT
jgi:putative transposase